jgi:hypothetical protein
MLFGNRVARLFWVLLLVGVVAAAAASQGTFDVREYGAVGDGETLDTAAINKAIAACAEAGGGQVRFTPGRYLSGTIHLKSHVTLFLEAGSRLIGTADLSQYDQPTPPSYMPEANWGKWHRALILGYGLEDVAIAGPGTIDGNKVFDPTGEERMRGPHTFVFIECREVTVRDVSFIDSANYAIFFQASDEVDIRDVTFTGGWDGVHFRGAPQRACHNVNIMGCRFYTGDDSIAGRYWDNVVISDCVINSSCNGIRLIGPAEHLIIRSCLFYGPGMRPHRTSKRTNMLAGINLQPGAWDATKGSLDGVLITDITMKNVATPFHFALKPGNTAGRITVSRVTATGVYRAPCSVESWAETPFTDVVFRDVSIEFKGGGAATDATTQVKAPHVDARSLPVWGFYARNVLKLNLEDVRLTCREEDLRPVMVCDRVGQVTLGDFVFPRVPKAPDVLFLHDVDLVLLRQDDIPVVTPRCTVLRLVPQDKQKGFVAGEPFSAVVTVQNGDRRGLGRVKLRVSGETTTSWVWLWPQERTDVVFRDLVVPYEGTQLVEAGAQRIEVPFDEE